MRQWTAVGAKVLRRAAEIAHAGEVLTARLMQFRIYVASLPMCRAQFVDLDARLFDVLRQSLQRVMSAPLQASSQKRFLGHRSLGFSPEAGSVHLAADAARVRASGASSVYSRSTAEIDAAELDEDSLLVHTVCCWVESSILRTTQRLRARILGIPGAVEAASSPRPHGARSVFFFAARPISPRVLWQRSVAERRVGRRRESWHGRVISGVGGPTSRRASATVSCAWW